MLEKLVCVAIWPQLEQQHGSGRAMAQIPLSLASLPDEELTVSIMKLADPDRMALSAFVTLAILTVVFVLVTG